MLSAHDSTVSSSALASRAQRVPLPLPSAPRAPAQGGRREAAPEWADHALRATRAELQHGLMQPQAQVSPKYLYDARGCDLFEQITRLPEYYPRAPRPPSWPTLAPPWPRPCAAARC